MQVKSFPDSPVLYDYWQFSWIIFELYNICESPEKLPVEAFAKKWLSRLDEKKGYLRKDAYGSTTSCNWRQNFRNFAQLFNLLRSMFSFRCCTPHMWYGYRAALFCSNMAAVAFSSSHNNLCDVPPRILRVKARHGEFVRITGLVSRMQIWVFLLGSHASRRLIVGKSHFTKNEVENLENFKIFARCIQ